VDFAILIPHSAFRIPHLDCPLTPSALRLTVEEFPKRLLEYLVRIVPQTVNQCLKKEADFSLRMAILGGKEPFENRTMGCQERIDTTSQNMFGIFDHFYFPARNPNIKAANPNKPCSSQFDLGLLTSANFKARSVSSFSFSKAIR